jgi:hypothetical protein
VRDHLRNLHTPRLTVMNYVCKQFGLIDYDCCCVLCVSLTWISQNKKQNILVCEIDIRRLFDQGSVSEIVIDYQSLDDRK